MQIYLDEVARSDMVICSEYQHHIGKGVYVEIRQALRLEIPVFCIKRRWWGGLKLVPVTGIEVFEHWDWKVNYGTISCS